jgi:hypothetical protein
VLGHCVKCGYDRRGGLVGAANAKCPECGAVPVTAPKWPHRSHVPPVEARLRQPRPGTSDKNVKNRVNRRSAGGLNAAALWTNAVDIVKMDERRPLER